MRIEDVKAHLELLKQELRKTTQGKTMVRQDRSYKGNEDRGIFTYRVYFDIPTATNKEAIRKAIIRSGFHVTGYRVVGGSYGYTISFQAHT